MKGTRLTHYEITGRLGAGGMGEVYRATDLKLGRSVAIKILPAQFTHDTDRLARLEREARALASVNHPNIATIYGLEESGGQTFLVMEFVPGQALAERITRGPISTNEALEITRQVAAALEAAHAQGIIHRDLKPGNVMVTPDGNVKVLDFGLATITRSDPISSDVLTASPPLTETGAIVGTAAYMAPEQAEGKPVDKRADIWAFGVLLFELLAGERLFNGLSAQATLVQVLSRNPDLSVVPVEFRSLLRQCLQRDPNQRLRDIGDALPLVGQVSVADASGNNQPKRRSYWPWAATAVFGIAALVLAFVHFRAPANTPPARVRFSIPLPEGVKDTPLFGLAPDGNTLAYLVAGSKGSGIWVQSLDSLEPRLLLGPAAGVAPSVPFWSADGKGIMFNSGGRLKKADLAGGGVQTICAVSDVVLGGSENQAHVIIFGTVSSSGIMKVSASGGTATSVTETATRGQKRHAFPFFLPDGIHFLYVGISATPEESGLFVGSLDAAPQDQPRRRLLETVTAAEVVPGSNGAGQILFLRDGSLMTQDFDLRSLQIVGNPRTVVDGVGSDREFPYFASSASGNLIYRATPGQTSQMTWFDRKGSPLSQVGDPMLPASAPMLDPITGSKFVISRWDSTDRTNDIFLYTLAPYHVLRLARGPTLNESPVWAADGTRVAYASKRSDHYDLYQADANGDREPTTLLESSESKRPDSWSRDGYLLYGTRGDLWMLPPDRKPFPFLTSPANEFEGKFSPDGRWVAYLSDEAGTVELYARSFTPASGSEQGVIGPRIPVSTAGGNTPHWRADGREIFYRAPNGNLIAVPVILGSNAPFGQPSALFPAPAPNWDAAPDGQRFLFAIPVGQQTVAPFTVVLNWQTTSPR